VPVERAQLPPPVEIQMFAVVTPPLPLEHAEVEAETVEVCAERLPAASNASTEMV